MWSILSRHWVSVSEKMGTCFLNAPQRGLALALSQGQGSHQGYGGRREVTWPPRWQLMFEVIGCQAFSRWTLHSIFSTTCSSFWGAGAVIPWHRARSNDAFWGVFFLTFKTVVVDLCLIKISICDPQDHIKVLLLSTRRLVTIFFFSYLIFQRHRRWFNI